MTFAAAAMMTAAMRVRTAVPGMRVSVLMMIAGRIVVVNQTAGQQRIDRLVGAVAHARVETDSRFCQSRPRTPPTPPHNSASIPCARKTTDSTPWPPPEVGNDLAVQDGSLLDGIQLTLGGVAKMLNDLFVCISNCCDRAISSFRCFTAAKIFLFFCNNDSMDRTGCQ